MRIKTMMWSVSGGKTEQEGALKSLRTSSMCVLGGCLVGGAFKNMPGRKNNVFDGSMCENARLLRDGGGGVGNYK